MACRTRSAVLSAATLDVVDAVLLASVHDDASVGGRMMRSQFTLSP